MSTQSSTHIDQPSRRPAGLLLGFTGALLALLILNLALFDDLRIDPSVGVLETFTKPQHLSSLVAVLIAATLSRSSIDQQREWRQSSLGSRSPRSRSSTSSRSRSVRQ